MDKKQLRNKIIEKRINVLPDEKVIWDEIIFNKLIKSDDFKNSDCILTYVSTNTEVDTKSIIEYALMKGKTVAVPKCEKDSSVMRFYQIQSLDNLERGTFNILEPDRFCSELVDFNNAVCIVPGLSFNKNGYRLGYGRGYYDRFLTEHNIKSIGLCYKTFIIDNLPVESFDKAVDILITD